MRYIFLSVILVSSVLVSSCRSTYASAARPIFLPAPQNQNDIQLTKAVIYSLAKQRWRITSYELGRVNANYRNIRLEVNITVNGNLEIYHLHGSLDRGYANNLKRWINDFQHTLFRVSQLDPAKLDQSLRRVRINPETIEKLAK